MLKLLFKKSKLKSNLFVYSMRTAQFIKVLIYHLGDRGSSVVKVLCYKSEGRWFDPSWCHWNFSLT